MEHFYRAQQNLSSLHEIGWRPAEKTLPVFFNMRILDLEFYGITGRLTTSYASTRFFKDPASDTWWPHDFSIVVGDRVSGVAVLGVVGSRAVSDLQLPPRSCRWIIWVRFLNQLQVPNLQLKHAGACAIIFIIFFNTMGTKIAAIKVKKLS
jgi:hypothetical protein